MGKVNGDGQGFGFWIRRDEVQIAHYRAEGLWVNRQKRAGAGGEGGGKWH